MNSTRTKCLAFWRWLLLGSLVGLVWGPGGWAQVRRAGPAGLVGCSATDARLYGLLDRPTQVLPPSPQAALTFSYTPGFGQRQNGADRFFHTDWLGSTRYLSDSGGSFPDTLAFDAFGNRTSGSTEAYPSEFRFGATSGYETEYARATDPGVGLQLLGERYYDPAVGRFILPDPIGFGGGLNLYS